MMHENKSPYRGVIPAVIAMCLVPLLLTGLFYATLMLWQARFGVALNLASAKVLGCGLGVMFHIACWVMGAFDEAIYVVKNRLVSLFSDLPISVSLAFEWYREDIKMNGVAFWIYFSVFLANAGVALDALFDFLALRGWRF